MINEIAKLRLALDGKKNRNNPTLRRSKERAAELKRLAHYGDLSGANVLRTYFLLVQKEHFRHMSIQMRTKKAIMPFWILGKKILRRLKL
ncbi:MAG: hypothetical protein NZM26_04110 [Patescibacteria group bacterium]|nr:hypothetical protein [Patescibacteria group bacterium]